MTDTTHIVARLGHKGDGITETGLFVPRVLPGEEVSGQVEDNRIDAPRIITPSANRVKAPCSHYNTCGGCSLLHASDEFVAKWKTDVVETAMKAHSVEAEVRPVVTSPARSRRRATLSARRGKKGATVGFHGRRSGTVTSIENCNLLAPEIMAQLDAVEKLAMIGGSRKGELAVNVAVATNGIDVSVRGGKPLDRALETELAQIVHQFGLMRLAWDGEVIAVESPPTQQFGTAMVVPPSGAFLQATKEGEASLVAAMREAVKGAGRVVDLFAGSGTFSLPIAENATVHAVEGDRDMMDALDAGWRHATGMQTVTTETRDLFRRPLLPDELEKFDAIVIDPPRSGAAAQVAEIADSKVPVVGFVSCNPVTFARDAQRLISGGYKLDWVLPVDQFRWSAHVEIAARFSRI